MSSTATAGRAWPAYRGKQSLALDLALPQAVDALARVVEGADVLLTNMLPERQAKYGLDPETLLARHPRLIVARLSGYGPDGPEANAPAFDYSSYWARTGLMDQLHEPGAPPAFQRPGMGDHSIMFFSPDECNKRIRAALES